MVMWHIKFKGMSSRPGYYDQTDDLGMGSKDQLPLDFFESVGLTIAHHLNLLNELGNEIKCEVCQAFYLFCNEFHKFNNTRARILDSTFYTLKSHFCRKNVIILLCTQRCYGRHNVFRKSINHCSDQSCFLCINIYLTRGWC